VGRSANSWRTAQASVAESNAHHVWIATLQQRYGMEVRFQDRGSNFVQCGEPSVQIRCNAAKNCLVSAIFFWFEPLRFSLEDFVCSLNPQEWFRQGNCEYFILQD
jgi:hypothetical protein